MRLATLPIRLAAIQHALVSGSDSKLRCFSPSPRPSPAGRGRRLVAVTANQGCPMLVKAAAGPLSQRERDGVRESASDLPSALFSTAAPLISTGLQPGVSAREEGSRFNGFLSSASAPCPVKTVETVLPSKLAYTRLKPGANERGRRKSSSIRRSLPFFLSPSF
jgi:hypothetical protein